MSLVKIVRNSLDVGRQLSLHGVLIRLVLNEVKKGPLSYVGYVSRKQMRGSHFASAIGLSITLPSFTNKQDDKQEFM